MNLTGPGPSPDAGEVEYVFNRSVCLAWTAFSLAMVAASIVIAVTAMGPLLPGSSAPAWLFGASGAALFSVMGFSWARRLLYRGPALVLSREGIVSDGRAGGLTTPSIRGVIAWDEIESASPDAFGSVILHLVDPDGFWARQSAVARMLAWHPSPQLKRKVILGGHDVADGRETLIDAVNAHLDERGRPGDAG